MTPLPPWARGASLALFALLSTLLAVTPAEAHRRDLARRAARRSPAPVVRLPTEERRHMAVERFLRNDGIRQCWARQLYRDPGSAPRRLTVGLAVDRDGRIAAVRVRDVMAPALASCIAASSVRVAPVGPGDAFEAEGTLTLERGE